MWNWKEIQGTKNLPPFGRVVLLYWEKDGNKYAITGNLKSIDENGAHWTFGQTVDIFNIFTMVSTKRDDNQPTHWCDVVIPSSEKSKSDKPTESDLSGLSEFELSCDKICDEILKAKGSLERIYLLKEWYLRYQRYQSIWTNEKYKKS